MLQAFNARCPTCRISFCDTPGDKDLPRPTMIQNLLQREQGCRSVTEDDDRAKIERWQRPNANQVEVENEAREDIIEKLDDIPFLRTEHINAFLSLVEQNRQHNRQFNLPQHVDDDDEEEEVDDRNINNNCGNIEQRIRTTTKVKSSTWKCALLTWEPPVQPEPECAFPGRHSATRTGEFLALQLKQASHTKDVSRFYETSKEQSYRAFFPVISDRVSLTPLLVAAVKTGEERKAGLLPSL